MMPKSTIPFIFTVMVALLTIQVTAAKPDKGFIKIFDGKTLDGWTAENGCRADVAKGTIRLLEGNGWLRSDRTFGDFLLHVEWKAEKDAMYDAGIYIRTQPGGSPFPSKGYQLNLLEGAPSIGIVGFSRNDTVPAKSFG